MDLPTRVEVDLPPWFAAVAATLPDEVVDLEDRMRIVVDLSRRNVEADTGGPFAAGVFEREGGRIVALGVNRVVPAACSCAHAEFMALSLAQQALATWDLGAEGLPDHQLVVNWLPCTMCFGSTLWSGVTHLVVAGAGPELEELTGFDEGPMPPGWRDELAARGIELTEDVLRADALAVFEAFGRSGAAVYNGRGGGRR